MTWIKTIPYEAATGKLKRLYDRIKGPGNNIDNVMLTHSLRPHTMEGHMAIYKSVLHHSANEIPKWFLETLGVWVSMLNECAYCVDHHFGGLKRLLDDDVKAQGIWKALRAGKIELSPLTAREKAALAYARILTKNPQMVKAAHIDLLREVGFTDGEILEINQVSAYFSYANRTVLGLGCSTKGEVIGLSPNDPHDLNDSNHSH